MDMHNYAMSKFGRVTIGFLCFLGFAFVRFRESELFYDPFLSFFKGYYQQLDMVKLMLHIGWRYAIHLVLSLVLLWVVFLEKGIVKFALLLYVIVFLVLLSVLTYLIHSFEIGATASIFYTRRFLIQPLLLCILLPAFFYYRKVNSK
jgi:exosortase F-associated protein